MRGELNQFTNFSGGLNSENAAFLLNEGECRDCLNVSSTARGAIQQRNGTQSFATHVSLVFNTLFSYEAFIGGSAVAKYLIVVSNSGVIRAIANNGVIGSDIASGLNASTQWEFEQFPGLSMPGSPGYMFGVNGVNTPRLWSGATQNTAMQTWSTVNTGTLAMAAPATGFVSGTNPSVLRFASLPIGFGYSSTLTFPGGPVDGLKVVAIDTSQGDARVTVTTQSGGVVSQNIANGTTITATNPGAVPAGRLVTQWSGRLWMAGVNTLGSRLYYSDVADAFSWPQANSVDLDIADGDPIVGLKVSGPYLLVFKENKVYAIYDIDPDLGPLFRTISANIGACSHRAIVETPRGAFFLSPDKGVWKTDGSSVTLASKDVTQSFALSAANRDKASAAYFNDHVYFSFAGPLAASDNDTVMDYDLEIDAWWKHDNAVRDFTVWRGTTSATPKLYGIRTITKNSVLPGVDELFVNGLKTDLGAAFTTRWVSAWHQMKVPSMKKRLRRLTFEGTGNVTAWVSMDFSPGWLEYATFTSSAGVGYNFGDVAGPNFGKDLSGNDDVVGKFGGGTDVTSASAFGVGGPAPSGKLGVGKAISVKFESNSINGLGVNSYTIAFTRRKN